MPGTYKVLDKHLLNDQITPLSGDGGETWAYTHLASLFPPHFPEHEYQLKIWWVGMSGGVLLKQQTLIYG